MCRLGHQQAEYHRVIIKVILYSWAFLQWHVKVCWDHFNISIKDIWCYVATNYKFHVQFAVSTQIKMFCLFEITTDDANHNLILVFFLFVTHFQKLFFFVIRIVLYFYCYLYKFLPFQENNSIDLSFLSRLQILLKENKTQCVWEFRLCWIYLTICLFKLLDKSF